MWIPHILIEPAGTSFDCYVLGACGSTSVLARMVWEKIHCSYTEAIITRSKTVKVGSYILEWEITSWATEGDVI